MQIIIAMVFLWREMGIATLSGAAALALLIPFNAWVAGRSKGFQVGGRENLPSEYRVINFNFIHQYPTFLWKTGGSDEK